MQHIKVRAESVLVEKQLAKQGAAATITHAIIGRPVNFQGIGGEESNRQAESILTLAAKRAGFVDVDFLFEPLAAGMDYEATLTDNKTVLVVDVGGGTTDCSVVKMGPPINKKRIAVKISLAIVVSESVVTILISPLQ